MLNSKTYVVIESDTNAGVSYSVREIDLATGTLSGGWKPHPNNTYIDPKGRGTNIFKIKYTLDSKRKAERIRDKFYEIAELAGKAKLSVNA